MKRALYAPVEINYTFSIHSPWAEETWNLRNGSHPGQASDQRQTPLDFTLPINTIINTSVTKALYNQRLRDWLVNTEAVHWNTFSFEEVQKFRKEAVCRKSWGVRDLAKDILLSPSLRQAGQGEEGEKEEEIGRSWDCPPKTKIEILDHWSLWLLTKQREIRSIKLLLETCLKSGENS